MILNLIAFQVLKSDDNSSRLEIEEITFSTIQELRVKIREFASERECVPMLHLDAENLHDVTFDIEGNLNNLNFQGAMYKIDNFHIEHDESKYKITGEAKARLIKIKPL